MNKAYKNRLRLLPLINVILFIVIIVENVVITNAINSVSYSEIPNQEIKSSASDVYIPEQVDIPTISIEEVKSIQLSAIENLKRVEVSRGTSIQKIDEHAVINDDVKKICSIYGNVEPELVMSVIKHESDYNPKAQTGNCVGLMQVSTYWQANRAKELGVTDFYDPYSNILVGVDYLSELFSTYKDPSLALMLYNMNHNTAFRLYAEGKTSDYAKSVLKEAEVLRKESS